MSSALEFYPGEEWKFDLGVAAGLSLLYIVISKLVFPAEKERAWILGAFSSTLCTLIGIYFCTVEMNWNIFHHSWDSKTFVNQTFTTRFTVRYFIIANVLDVVIGLIQYRSQLFTLTTWIHHGAYVLLCVWMLKTGCSVLFGLCLIEELPTAIMSYGRLNKRYRSDQMFGLAYFLLRVVLHTWLSYSVLFQLRDDDRLGVARLNFVLTEFLHCHWFFEWVRQQMRLMKKNKKN